MKTILIILLSSFCSLIIAQLPEESYKGWISGGMGLHKNSFLDGLTFFSSYTGAREREIQKHDKIIHNTVLGELRYLKHFGLGDEKNHSNSDELDLLVGVSIGTIIQLRLSGGIGIVNCNKSTGNIITKPPESWKPHLLKIGIPLEIGLQLSPVKYFGLGIKGYTNINPGATFSGIVLNVEIGKLY